MVAPGNAVKKGEKKDRQLNVRFTRSEIETLQHIAEMEDRDLSYVVSFFVCQGVREYSKVGSLMQLRNVRLKKSSKSKIERPKESMNGFKIAANGRIR